MGEVVDGEMVLSEFGEIVQDVWDDLPSHYPHVWPDEFVIMPNHIHGIIQLTDENSNRRRGGFLNPPLQPMHDLSEIVRGFKTWSARKINHLRHTPSTPFWQRSFYDHIIRDQHDLDNIRSYIRHNPLKWDTDRENPQPQSPY